MKSQELKDGLQGIPPVFTGNVEIGKLRGGWGEGEYLETFVWAKVLLASRPLPRCSLSLFHLRHTFEATQLLLRGILR